MSKTIQQRRQRRNERKTRKKTSRLRANGRLLRFTAEASVNLTAAEGQLPTFEMVAYSGGKLFVAGFEHPVVVDLSATEVKGQDGSIPITLDHHEDQRVGHTTSVTVTPNNILMAGVASAETEWRDEVVASAKNGFKWQASIEGRVMGKEMVPEGKQITVNGRTFQGPLIVARPFVLRATSFVSSGGDEDNVVRLAASNDTGDNEMDKHFKEWLEAKGFDAELVASNQTQHDFLKAQFEGDKKPEGEPVKAAAAIVTPDPVASMREAAAKELERQAGIHKICAGGHPDLQAKAIREGWTIEKSELEVLRATREQATPAIHVSDKASKKTGAVLEASLLRSCGINPEKCGYDQPTLEATDKVARGYGLHALMHDVLRASGRSYQSGVYDNDFIRETFRANSDLSASGSNHLQANEGFSTISLTGVLSNVANKALLAAYNSVSGVRYQIAKRRQVRDFKAFTSYRITGNGVLEKLGPDGEIKHAEMTEESYSNQIDTYARMMALTRKMMINDDLGAFMEIPQSFGRLAGITEEKVLFEVLLAAISGAAFFTSGRGNLLSGATYALAIDGLSAGETAMWKKEDSEGNPILAAPKLLLVPPDTATVAGQLYRDTQVNETTTANKGRPTSNPHAGKFLPVMSPFFGTSQGITGGSTTHWLMLCDPMDVAVIEFAELQGQSGPIIESAETDFNTLGMQWRAYRDFGAAMQDHRGGVYANGTG